MIGAIVLAGCGEGAWIDDDPVAQRYPDTLLPWRARAGTVVERGGLGYAGALTAVVALEDRVVVVFPPEDRVGLDLAYGGVDLPWTRERLTDLPVGDLGDLDAVASPDGEVWITVRERYRGQAISLYRWRPGGSVSVEPIPRPAPSQARRGDNTCDDVAFAVSRDDAQAIAFLQDDGGGESYLLVLDRDGDSGPWTVRNLGSADNGFFEVGCRLLLVHDDGGRPEVMGVARTLATDEHLVSSAYLGGDGRYRGAVTAPLPDGRIVRAGPDLHREEVLTAHAPQFDLDVRRDGILVAAPAPPRAGEAFRAHGVSFVVDLDAMGWADRGFPADRLSSVGGKLLLDDCGRVGVAQETEGGLVRVVPECPWTRRAPLLGVMDRLDNRHPVHARGLRPYDVALCTSTTGVLHICHGGHAADRSGARPASLPDPLRLVDARIDGDVLRFEVSRALASREVLIADLADLATGANLADGGEIRAIDATRWELAPAGGWLPTAYRFAISSTRGDAGPPTWAFTDTPPPVAWFDARASIEDPRDVAVRATCPGTRGPDGICVLDGAISAAAPGSIVFPFVYDDAGRPPLLHDAMGTVVPTTFGREDHRVVVTWTTPLEPGARYDLIIITGAPNIVGGPLHDDDLRIGFVTAP